ncbi:hypothetical protein VTK73DRAFT_344 [Phialemonium thermophilum]|uniref:Uncharacterized protein n=1 Tax=Phialemonium thermophilum TaxID=223376 RepID=A0ABR3VVM2_9PEZI
MSRLLSLVQTMRDLADSSAWYSKLAELHIIPRRYDYFVRLVSGFFITLACAAILPVVGLVVYDIVLYLCRHVSSSLRPARAPPLESRRRAAEPALAAAARRGRTPPTTTAR